MEKTVVWNYREILFCLQLVFHFLQLATHLLLLPGKQPTTCQSLLLANYPQRPSALLRVAKHWGCVLDQLVGFSPAQFLVLLVQGLLHVQQVVELLLELFL